ncbi:MAG: alkaline phosphatase D family protein [Pontixanthobacter sp.]
MAITTDRRGALGLLGASGALALPGCATIPDDFGPVRFAHGVASGDPAADGAVIWTRISVGDTVSSDVPVRWHVSAAAGDEPVASGSAIAAVSADRTVKVELAGLQPGRDYWYRFEGPDGNFSPEGRFRTLPVGAVRDVVFAIASCQLYPGGYFNAYADMARLDRLDAVLMLGDYIYEYGQEGYGGEIGRQLGRLLDPPHEITTLDHYRRRHAQVKADPDMQAAHARAAFICVWDDHETANDSWIGGAQNHQSETEGNWQSRKAAAMQAYFEWMPIRSPAAGSGREAIYRSFEFGNLASLAMLETRLVARTKPVEYDGETGDGAAYARLLTQIADKDRELVGRNQQEWLEKVLSGSVAAGKRWQIVANQVIMARVTGPDLEAGLGKEAYDTFHAKLPPIWQGNITAAQAGFRAGLPFNLDAWDGYPAARDRLLKSLRSTGAQAIVLAGDSHAGWANNLHDDAGNFVALEAGCTAVTSPSYGSLLPGIGRYIEQSSEEVVYCNQDLKGYSLLTLTSESATVEFVTVSTVLARDFSRNVDRSFAAGVGSSFGPWHPAAA